jgi:hypothetical protein
MKIERPIILERPLQRLVMTLKITFIGIVTLSVMDSFTYKVPVTDNFVSHISFAFFIALIWTILIPTMRQYKILFKGDPRRYF